MICQYCKKEIDVEEVKNGTDDIILTEQTGICHGNCAKEHGTYPKYLKMFKEEQAKDELV